MHTGVRPFLLACLRARIRPAERDALLDAALPGAPPWDDVLRVAETERVAPLLYDVLRHRTDVDAAFVQALGRSFHRTTLRNMLAFRELGEVLAELTRAGVPVVVLKGAALAEAVYRNIGLRPMYDIDIFVRRLDVPAIVTALSARGYNALPTKTAMGSGPLFEHGVVLHKPRVPPVELEMHWSLLEGAHHRQPLAFDWVWDHTVQATVGSVSTQVLAPAALLLHLCAHWQLHHGGHGLLWGHDIAEVLHAYRASMNWDFVFQTARESALVMPLREAVLRVGLDWGITLPATVIDQLRTLEPAPIEYTHQKPARASNPLRRLATDMMAVPGWAARIRFAITDLFPRASYMRERYHVRSLLLLPAYYPYRWLCGLWRFVASFHRVEHPPAEGREP